ncbi:MAG: hypothetical protein WD696_07990 [Bryobacteraceae bacterium]
MSEPQEYDRKILPGFVQDTFAISLGMAYKSFEMMKSPQESMGRMMDEMKTLFTIPSDAGEGARKKAEAVAAVWMEKGAMLMEECKTAGQKFTEGK